MELRIYSHIFDRNLTWTEIFVFMVICQFGLMVPLLLTTPVDKAAAITSSTAAAFLGVVLIISMSDIPMSNSTFLFLRERWNNAVIADGTGPFVFAVLCLTTPLILELIRVYTDKARCCVCGRKCGCGRFAARAAHVIAAEERAYMGAFTAKRDPSTGAWPAAAPSTLKKPVLGDGVPPLEMRAVALFKRRCDLNDDLCETSAEALNVKNDKGHATFTRMRVPATSVVRVLRDGLEGSTEYHRSRRAEASFSLEVRVGQCHQRAVLAQLADNVAQLANEFAQRTLDQAKRIQDRKRPAETPPGKEQNVAPLVAPADSPTLQV